MDSTTAFVKQYLNLININQIQPPSLDYLRNLQNNHIETLAWSTVDLYLARNINLDPQAILQKFLTEYRGGVCYELNGAFCYLLNQLGFDAYLASSYVHGYNDQVFDFKIDTHVVIILKFLEQLYLVDVGWGDSYRHPVLLQDKIQFSDKSGKYILHSKPDFSGFEMKLFYNGEWRKQYDFSLIPSQLTSFYQNLEVIYHDPSHHSHRQLNCVKPNYRGYTVLKNDELIIKINDQIEKKNLDSLEIPKILINYFCFDQSFVTQYFSK